MGAFGAADPRDPADRAAAPHSGTGAYGQELRAGLKIVRKTTKQKTTKP